MPDPIAAALQRLRGDLEAATEGAWFQFHDEGAPLGIIGHALDTGGMTLLEVNPDWSDDGADGLADAAHIVSIHNAAAALIDAAEAAAALLDLVYPGDIFSASSGDPGVLAVVKARAALAALAEAVEGGGAAALDTYRVTQPTDKEK